MNKEELVSMLSSITGIDALASSAGHIEVSVGEGVPLLLLDPDRVVKAETVDGPTGPAIKLDLSGEVQPWFVTDGDVAYPPDTSALKGPSGMTYRVGDLPPVVGWRDMLWMLSEAERPFDGNFDRFHAQVLSCEAILLGARRAGLAVDETDVPTRVAAVRQAFEQQ